MRVPDETEYKKGQPHIEDIRGYQSCLHCSNCPLTTQQQCRSDGQWYCSFFKRWKDGNDLVEFMCAGYQLKSCSLCISRGFCSALIKSSAPFSFCNSFSRKGVDRGSMISGRVRQISPLSSSEAMDAEQAYIDRKLLELKEDCALHEARDKSTDNKRD